MKQTNSTITFLAAQYRAVLKDAYLKGLASTALLSTAALASVYSSSAEAATKLDNLEQLGTAGDYTLDDTAGSKDLRVNKDLNWQGNLTVNSSVKGDPHKIISNVEGADINGNGSLSVNGKGAVVAVGEPQGNYEFKMDLGSIDIQEGEMRVRSGFHMAGNTQVSADNITVGSGDPAREAIIHVAGMGDNGSVAALGRTETADQQASVINLKSGGRILLNGQKAEHAVLQGQITGNGGTISFAENSGQPGFYNNGTIKATGVLENTTIKVGGRSTAVFDFDKALGTIPGSDSHLKLNSGTLEIKGAPAQADTGRVEIHNGTLELGANAKISNNHEQNALLTIGGGDEDQEGRLKASWGHVNEFVNAKNGNHHGTIEIRKDGVLEMANANGSDIHLNNFDFNDKRFMGQIQVHDGGTVAADNLKIDRALKTGAGASAGWSTANSLDLRADTLKLKESGAGNIDYKFRKAVTKNLQLEANGGWKQTFNLKNDIRIVNSQMQAHPDDANGPKYYQAGQTAFNSAVSIDKGGRLDVAAGTLTTKGKVTLNEGSMNVGGQELNDTYNMRERTSGVDAQWKAVGGLHITSKAPTSISIKGTGEQTVGADANGSGGKTIKGQAVLDLTSGKLTIAGNSKPKNKATFDIQDGSLKLSTDNARELLDTQNKRKGNTAIGAAVHLGGNASMVIEGELNALDRGKSTGISTEIFKQVSGADQLNTDEVGISGTGNTVQAVNMHLKGAELNPGEDNSFIAREGMTIDAQKQSNGEFALTSGRMVVGNRLSSDGGVSQINVGKDASTAELELGYAKRETDRFGDLTAAGAAGTLTDKSADTGNVQIDIKLDGINPDKLAALKVKYGKWSAKDIDASQNGLIEVGSALGTGETAAPVYGNGVPALEAATVTLADGSQIIVHDQSSVDFDKLDMKGGKVKASGDMHFDDLAMANGTIDTSSDITAGTVNMTGGTINAGKNLTARGPGASNLNGGLINVSGDAVFEDELNAGGTHLTGRKNVTVLKDMNLSSGSVTAAGTFQGQGDVNQTGGVLSAGTINVSGDYTMDNGAIGGAGDMTVSGDMTVTSGGVTVNKNLTANNFDFRGGEINVKGNSVALDDYKVSGKALVRVSGDGVASGDYIMEGGAAKYGGSLIVGKNLDARAGVLTAGKDIKVSGDSSIGKVTVTASGDFITGDHVSLNNGTVNAGKNFQYGTMQITAGKVNAGGNVSGGNITMSGGTIAGSGDFTVGAVTMSGGTVTAGGKYQGDDITMSGGSLTTGSDMTVDNVIITSGTVTAGGTYSGGDLTMSGGELSSSGDMTVDNVNMTEGTVTAGGRFSGGNLTMSGGSLNGKSDITVNNVDINKGTVTAGGVFNGNNVNVSGGSITTSGAFTASGELYVEDSGTVSAGGNLAAQEIYVNKGEITSNGNLSSDGYIEVYDSKLGAAGNLHAAQNMIVSGTSEVQVSGNGLVEGKFNMKGGTASFDRGLAVGQQLVIDNGDLTSKDTVSAGSLDLNGGSLGAGDFSSIGNTTLAGGNFNVSGSANVGGNLKATGGTANIGNRLDIQGNAQLDGGKITAGGALTAGTMHINGADVSAGNGLITGNLEVSKGSLTVSGAATVGPLEINGGSMSVNGQLAAGDVGITAGELNTSGSMTADRLNMAGGTINIGNLKGPDGSIIKNGDLTVKDFAMSDGVLNIIESKMTAGKAPLGTAAGDKLDYGFTTTGGDINISGATAKLELGIEALRDLVFKHDISGNNGNEHPEGSNGGPIDPKDKYTNNITLSDGATIKFNFDNKTFLTKEDIKKLKEEFLKNPDGVPDGNIDIGDALLDGLEDVFLPNGDVDWQKLKVFISSMGLDGVKIDKLDEARLVNIKDGEKVVAHVGSMRVDGNDVLLGNGSLNNAAKNNGNFVVDTTNNDALIDVTLDSGASFAFNNGGNLKDIILKAGKESDKTNVVIGGNSSTVTNINKIQGQGDYTNVFIDALTSIAEGIDNVDRVSVTGETTIGKNLTNIDKLEAGNKLNVAGNLENVKDIAISSGDVTVGGSITGTDNISSVSGSLSVQSGLDKVKQIIAHSSDINLKGGIANTDKLQLVEGSNLTTSGSGLQSIKEITLAASKAVIDGAITSGDSLTMVKGSELSASGSLDQIKDITLSASKATIGGGINGTTSLALVSKSELNTSGALNDVQKVTVHDSKASIGGGISGTDTIALTGGSDLKTQGGIDRVKEVLMAASTANIGGAINGAETVIVTGKSELNTTNGGLEQVKNITLMDSKATIGGGINNSDSLTLASGSELTTADAINEVKKIIASASAINAGKGIKGSESLTAVSGSTITTTGGGLSSIKDIGISDSTANIGGDISTSDKMVALNSTVNVNGNIDKVKDLGLGGTTATVGGSITNADKLTAIDNSSLTTTGGIDNVKNIAFNKSTGNIGGVISGSESLQLLNSELTAGGGINEVKKVLMEGSTVNAGGDIANADIMQLTSGSKLASTGGVNQVKQIVVMNSSTDIAGRIDGSETIEIGSGSTVGAGGIANSDTLVAQDSTIKVSGDIDNVRKLMTSNTKTEVGGSVFNFDKVLADSGALNVSGSIASGSELNMISGTTLTAQNIDGVKNVYLGGTADIAQNIQNGEVLSVNGGGTVTAGNNVTGMNRVQVTAGTLKVGKDLEKSTQLDVVRGSTLEVGGNINDIEFVRANGKIVVAGTFKAQNLTGTVPGATPGTPENPGSTGASIEAQELDITGNVDTLLTEYSGDMKVKGKARFGNQAILSGNNEFGSVEFTRGVHLAKGNTTAGQLDLAQGVEVRAGSDGKGGTAHLLAGYANLNGGTIVADPEYGEKATIVAMNNMGTDPSLPQAPEGGTTPDAGTGTTPDAGTSPGTGTTPGAGGTPGTSPETGAPAKLAAAAAVTRAGELNGTVVALKNAVIAMGTSAKDVDGAVNEIQTALAPYFKNGSLQDPASSPDAIGSVAYVGRPVTLASGSKIVVDATRGYDEYHAADAQYKGLIAANDIYVDNNSALVLHNDVVQGTDSAAITFKKPDASMYAKKGSKLLIAGTTINPNAPIKVFRDTNGKIELITEDGKPMDAESVNGLFEAPEGFGPGQVDDLFLTVNQTVADKSFNDVSQPVRDSLAQYGGFDNNPNRPPLHGDVASGVTYNPDNQQFTDGSGNVLTATNFVPVKNPDGSYSVYHKANNPLLNYIVTATNSGRDAEAVARMSSLGGTARSALTASEVTTDAIAARSGMTTASVDDRYTSKPVQAVPWMNDKRNEKQAYSKGSTWMTPTYRKVDSDGLTADNKSYGNDIKLAGMTAGLDVRVHPNVEVGAAISAGTVDGDSKGLVSGVKNEGKYIGAAAYGRYTRGPISVLADMAYTQTNNDLSTQTAVGEAKASVSSKVITAGVTARQKMQAGPVEVTPHAGIRLTHVSTSDHDVSINGSTIARSTGDTANMVSIPVGVTVSRNIKHGTWNIKPSLDLTMTANVGDKSSKNDVKWQGVNNMTTSLDSQIVDDYTAGIKAGVTVRNGRFAAGAGVAYRTSDSTKDLAVEANARYDY